MSSANSTIPKPHYAKTSQDPLSDVVRHGMVAMGIAGFVSTMSTLSLLVFMTYRMIFWRRYYEQSIARNQVLLLIYNLLIADLQQSLAFVISFYWLWHDKLVGPHPMCSAQGWFIQIGDVSSGFWVLSIGIHTFVNLVLRRTIPIQAFVVWAVTIWIFCILISAAGPIKHNEIFIPTAAWCWIGMQYRWERLYLHYAYIFLAELGSIIVYAFIIIFLHDQLSTHSRNHASTASVSDGNAIAAKKNHAFAVSRARILKTARCMVLYPAAYVTLTLPLAAARVTAMAGGKPKAPIFILAGTMIGSCGWVDVLLYITTRKVLVSTKRSGKSGLSPWHEFRMWIGRVFGRTIKKENDLN